MYDKIDETSEAMAENTFRKARAKLNDMKDEIYKAYKEEKLQSTTRKDLENIIDHIISSIETLE